MPRKRISDGPKGIVAIIASINAMKASAGAIRKNTFTIREVSLYRIFTSEIWGENGRILPFKPKRLTF